MTDKIIFIEKESAIRFWHYLFCLTIFLFNKNYLMLFISILTLFIISKYMFLINNEVTKINFKYSTAILNYNGFIDFNNIENIEKVSLPVLFKFYKIKLYQYCNSNRWTNIEYGLKIHLKNGKYILIPSRKANELKEKIELQLKKNCK